jgi:hypothetical protein
METDPNFIQALIAPLLSNPWVGLVTLIISFGAGVSAIFPSKLGKDTWFGKALQLFLDVSNAAGLNFGAAKNADDA